MKIIMDIIIKIIIVELLQCLNLRDFECRDAVYKIIWRNHERGDTTDVTGTCDAECFGWECDFKQICLQFFFERCL